MRLVTDGAADMAPEQMEGLDIVKVPLYMHLDGKTYRPGIDIGLDEAYALMDASENMAKTSQPSPKDFADVYREIAKEDPDIFSIHISQGLSGTVQSARLGAEMVPEANITVYDTRTITAEEGWQVEAAARAIKAGWEVPDIIELVKKIYACSEMYFSVPKLDYLIHGGRISHISGLIANALNLRPIISVDRETGKYYTRGIKRTFKQALKEIVKLIRKQFPDGTHLRAQIGHIQNTAAYDYVAEMLEKHFKVTWVPETQIDPVLGAHVGPGLIGVLVAPMDLFPELP